MFPSSPQTSLTHTHTHTHPDQDSEKYKVQFTDGNSVIPCLCQGTVCPTYFISCHVALPSCHSGLHFVLMWISSLRVETLFRLFLTVYLARWAQPTSNPTYEMILG